MVENAERANPAHVTLAVVLQVRDGRLEALLWQRALEPFAGSWSLPGGYLLPGETLESSIRRHLAVKVDVRELSHLEQLETLSEPHRHPGEWQLATAYLGLVPSDVDPVLPPDTSWHPVDAVPPTAFDHREIVLAGRTAGPPPRQAFLHEHRLRPGAGRLHDLGAPRPLRRGARSRGLGDEPSARARPEEASRAHRRAA